MSLILDFFLYKHVFLNVCTEVGGALNVGKSASGGRYYTLMDPGVSTQVQAAGQVQVRVDDSRTLSSETLEVINTSWTRYVVLII